MIDTRFLPRLYTAFIYKIDEVRWRRIKRPLIHDAHQFDKVGMGSIFAVLTLPIL